jgi:ACS family tartrate transporter-like MFS transporter
MSSILQDWYQLDVKRVLWLIIIPPLGSLLGQLLIGWNSDRTGERRLHASLPIVLGGAALASAPFTKGNVVATVVAFTLAMTGAKAYLPAFWALPSLLMTASAAAASIGLINSFGNLGGWVGPTVVGFVKEYCDKNAQGSAGYSYGLWFLAASMLISSLIIASLGIGQRERIPAQPTPEVEFPTLEPL